MCGICGYRSQHPVPLEKMISILHHRGPDDSGIFRVGDVGLGHKRLSIIDLKTGHQPMLSTDKSIALIFNGEIYNYLELKKILKRQGYIFRTTSDTEVLLRLYERDGTDCLKHLNGEFAFVVYDQRNNTLFGARDRLGIKPFYYTLNEKGLFFASEIKSLFETGYIRPVVNKAAVDLYFTYRYVPGQDTIYKDIEKVLPGHAFIQLGNEPPKFWKYWDLPLKEEPQSFDVAYEHFQNVLTESVKYRLISDVPLGVFLSGGVDSSTVVGLMAGLEHKPIRSFTVGFEEELDETQTAADTAAHFGCEHHSFKISPENLELLPKIIWHMDEPFGDAILVPTYCLSQQAVKSVKVVLTGEGADEAQMGYIHHNALRKGFLLSRLLHPRLMKILGKAMAGVPVSVLNKFFQYPSSMGSAGRNRLAELLSLLDSPGQAYQHFCSLFTEEERQRLYGPGLKAALSEAKEKYHEPLLRKLDESKDPLRDIYLYEIKHWLPDNILNKQDRMTMANSLEARVPFLDHRLIELEATLPLSFKMKGSQGKYLLRCLYRNLVAGKKHIQNKRAFLMPLDGSAHVAYQALVEKYLSAERVDSYLLNKEEIKAIIKNAESSPLLGQKKVMALISFQIWQDVFKPVWE